MRTIEVVEAEEWSKTLTNIAQSLQDKSAALDGLSAFDQYIYDKVIEMRKKLSQVEHPEPAQRKTAEEILKKVCRYPFYSKMEYSDDIEVGEAIEAIEEYHAQFSKPVTDSYTLNPTGEDKIKEKPCMFCGKKIPAKFTIEGLDCCKECWLKE